MIKKIDNNEEKEKICMEILEALPEWGVGMHGRTMG